MNMKTFSFLMVFTAAACATNLLLPLYVWPEGGAWGNVYKAIEANSQLTFQVIINPNSGPGSSTSGDSQEYSAAVSKLNSYPNVQIFGYVHCNYGTSSGDEVNHNVTQWNSWNSDPKISIDGIFYDEIPNEEGSSESVNFLASLVETAKSTFGSHPFSSIFNPGATPMYIELYDLADFIVVFESEASLYSETVIANQIPAGKAGQSSILIYNFAGEGHEEQLGPWLQGMISAGVGSSNILNTGYSEANSDDKPAGLGSVASILASSAGQSTAKPINGTGSTTSKLAPEGSLSAHESMDDTASMPAPETGTGNEPVYNPHSKHSDGDEDEHHQEDDD